MALDHKFCSLNLKNRNLKVRYLAQALNLRKLTCQNENLSRLRSYYLSKSDFANKFDGCKFIKKAICKNKCLRSLYNNDKFDS